MDQLTAADLKQAWADLYKHWNRYWLRDRPPGNNLTDIPVSCREGNLGLTSPVVDWWPNHEIDKRRRDVQTHGRTVELFWHRTNKGTYHTVDMLVGAGDNA